LNQDGEAGQKIGASTASEDVRDRQSEHPEAYSLACPTNHDEPTRSAGKVPGQNVTAGDSPGRKSGGSPTPIHQIPDGTTRNQPPNADVCLVSKSIEAVFESKTNAHRRRKLEQQKSSLYHVETRRPIVCLAFVLPLLMFYELGSILLGHQSLRSGIDQWFHQPLHQLGLGSVVVLPIVTIAILLIWHHQRHDHWKIRPKFLVGMLAEAVGLGLIMFWAANAILRLVEGDPAIVSNAVTAAKPTSALWAGIVASVGSGIYEELIFRIGLLSLLTLWARKLVPDKQIASVVGVVAVSVLFAALHYSIFNPAGNHFELSTFIFRTFASIVFCVLFIFRGFGIAAGVHVAYDVLTQV
jgi:hypothetical protein